MTRTGGSNHRNLLSQFWWAGARDPGARGLGRGGCTLGREGALLPASPLAAGGLLAVFILLRPTEVPF